MIIQKMTELGAAFFDIFGAIIFAFLIAASLYALKNKGRLPEWILYLFIAIGLSAFFIDLFNVYSAFLK